MGKSTLIIDMGQCGYIVQIATEIAGKHMRQFFEVDGISIDDKIIIKLKEKMDYGQCLVAQSHQAGSGSEGREEKVQPRAK